MRVRILISAFVSAVVIHAQDQTADVFSALVEVCTQNAASDTLSPVPDIFGVLDYVSNAEDGFVDSSYVRPVYFFPEISTQTPGSADLNNIFSGFSAGEYYTSGITQGAFDFSGPRTFSSGNRRITSRFGYRTEQGRMHYGIDLAFAVGDSVRVVYPGVVRRTGYEKDGYGYYVIVDHNKGLETRYAHLSSILVRPGDRVAVGTVIALSGNTGRSTGPHLHFEMRRYGLPVDPETMLEGSTLISR